MYFKKLLLAKPLLVTFSACETVACDIFYLRNNVKCIFLTGMTHIDNTYRYSGWINKTSCKKEEFEQRAQSFIKQRARCGLILKRLKDETPLEEHFIPFRPFLGKKYKSDIDKGLVGEDDDASWIIEGTGAEKAIYEEKKNRINKVKAELQKMELGSI